MGDMIQRYGDMSTKSGGGMISDIKDSSLRERGKLYQADNTCIPPVKSNPHFGVERGLAFIFSKYKNKNELFRSENESR